MKTLCRFRNPIRGWNRLVVVALLFLVTSTRLFGDSSEITVGSNFVGTAGVAASTPLDIVLSRPLQPSDGRLAVFIGLTDVTSLLVETTNGVRYAPSVLPLPAGPSEVAVYLVSVGGEWKKIANLPLSVADPVAAITGAPTLDPASGAPAAPASRRRERSGPKVKPNLTVGLKSQPAETHFPDTARPPRTTFADATLQGDLQTSWTLPGFDMQNQFQVVGSSFRSEALRFAQRGESAPKVDLSSYLVSVQMGKARLLAGHVTFGSSRHLINAFGTRGVSLTVPLRSWVDFSLAALNGTSIVGWDNFLGVANRQHQIVSGILGFELIPKRPGGTRVELSILDGSLLPLAGFNQGVITDTEKSRGQSARFIATDKAQRIRIEGGYTRSLFDNPVDPLLTLGQDVVPVRETSRNARYADVTVDILQNRRIGKTNTLNLSVTYRHEQVDPLFRSVAAFTQADRIQHQAEINSSIGPVNILVSHLRFHNNLDDVASVLTILTRRDALAAAVPFSTLFGQAGKSSRWWPTLSYTIDQTHAAGRPYSVLTGFDSVSQVPDQMSTNQNANLEWQVQRFRWGYRFNRSFQDNRQSGRDLADLRNLVSGFSFGVNARSNLDLTYELNAEGARNFELDQTNRLWRSSVNINWRMTKQAALVAILSGTTSGDLKQLNRSRNGEVDLQWSYRLGYSKGEWNRVQTQVSIRYANRYSRISDALFGFNNFTRFQTLNVNLTFTFF